MHFRKVSRMIRNKKAEAAVVSAVILAGVAIALGFAVLIWGQNLSQVYTKSYGDTTNSEIAKIKETLSVEYVYKLNETSVRIFILNSGAINDLKIQSIYLRYGGTTWVTSSPPTLKWFNGTTIPDQKLDVQEQGYVEFVSPVSFTSGGYYLVRIVTLRGSIFESQFVA